jgi:hypothetical protein
MKTFDLALAWNWEFDEEFIAGIERECAARRISTYRIEPANLRETIRQLESGEVAFRALFDRASDADPDFLPLVRLIVREQVFVINPHQYVLIAVDKATMHFTLATHGIHVPNTIIISPYAAEPDLGLDQAGLDRLGIPFVIKPANTTGGGTGVVLGARTLNDVVAARTTHPNDKYLVQETIRPIMLDGKRAWFRAYCIFGETIICWWDDLTHRYSELTAEEEARHALGGLRAIMKTIQQACRLDFFSSEIAVTKERHFIVVDYVNEVCDMRYQSRHVNGAPDTVVHTIERLIVEQTNRHISLSRPRAAEAGT